MVYSVLKPPKPPPLTFILPIPFPGGIKTRNLLDLRRHRPSCLSTVPRAKRFFPFYGSRALMRLPKPVPSLAFTETATPPPRPPLRRFVFIFSSPLYFRQRFLRSCAQDHDFFVPIPCADASEFSPVHYFDRPHPFSQQCIPEIADLPSVPVPPPPFFGFRTGKSPVVFGKRRKGQSAVFPPSLPCM